MDPIVTADERIGELKETVNTLIKGMDEMISMHDFRVVTGPTHTNLIFDILIPYKFRMSDEALMQEIRRQIKETLGDNFYAVMKVDKAYVK